MSKNLTVVWPTRSRTGSQFVVKMTTAVLGHTNLVPQARVSGARRDAYRPDDKQGDFHSMFAEGRGYEYIAENEIASLKFEDPGKDDFVLELLDKCPNALFVASHRRIERVLESHYNIKSWGHNEADVLYQFSASLHHYEEMHRRGRLFMISVDGQVPFDAKAFADFLGVGEVSPHASRLIDEWEPINDLQYQVERSGTSFDGRERPPRLERLRTIHPWVDELDARYRRLCETSGRHV